METQSKGNSQVEHGSPDCECIGIVCKACKSLKCILEFNRHKKYKGGRRYKCRACTRVESRVYRFAHLEEIQKRKRVYYQSHPIKQSYNLESHWKNFGISAADYHRMYESQNGLCAICGNPESAKSAIGETRHLSLDHDHATGQIRAFLCHRCNMLLGQTGDDANLLRTMADYLDYHKDKAKE